MQHLLDKWNIKIDYNTILSMWNESHRSYHSQTHLVDLIDDINQIRTTLTEKEYDKLILCALFHDIIYDPSKFDNEEKSAQFFINCCSDKTDPDILEVKEMILDTKTHQSDNKLSSIFNKLDMKIVGGNIEDLKVWEKGIKEEFVPVFGIDNYKKGRLQFLNSLLDKYPNNSKNLLDLIDIVSKY